MSKSWLLFCGLFSAVGIVCSLIGYRAWSKNRVLKSTGIETIATVIGQYKKKQINPSSALAVIIQYADSKGRQKTFYSTTFTTPVMFQVGEQIKIWYQKDNPENVLMEGKDEWLIPMVLFGFGIVFSLIGAPGFIKELCKG